MLVHFCCNRFFTDRTESPSPYLASSVAAALLFLFFFLSSLNFLPNNSLYSSFSIDLDESILSSEYQTGRGERRRGPAGNKATMTSPH